MFWVTMARRALFPALLVTLVAHQVHCEKNNTASPVADTSLTASASYFVDPQQQTSSSHDTWLQPTTGRGSVHTVDFNPVYRQTEKTNSVSPPAVIHQNRRSSYPIHQVYGRPQPQRIRPHPMPFRRPSYFVANRRQHFVNSVPPYLTAPRPPPAMSKASIVPRSPPHPQHVIYTKRPPEVIYYGPKPPPLDYSPPSSPPIYQKPSISSDEYPGSPISYRVPIRRPIISAPVQYSVPQEPADHDIMNDLDKYIPDDGSPSKSDNSYSPMASMMMPLMMLGLTLPMIGMAATYFARRRRRRRDVGTYSEEELNRILNLLDSYTEKSKKVA